MFQRILVPLDGAARAERAIPVAARIAKMFGGSIVLLQAVHPPVGYGVVQEQAPIWTEAEIEANRLQTLKYLISVSKVEELEGIGTCVEALSGAVAPTILSVVQSRDIDLVVMCSHGETGLKRWMVGSVAQKVARYCPAPVLVLHDGEPMVQAHSEMPHFLRALVALDGSPLAEIVLVPVAKLIAALAAPESGALHLTRVVTISSMYPRVYQSENERQAEAKKYLRAVAERLCKGDLAHLNLVVTWSTIVEVDVASALVKMAEHGEVEDGTAGCDLLAIATHGRSGLQRWVVGSIAERVLGSTTRPLLIVRPSEMEARLGSHELVAASMTGENP